MRRTCFQNTGSKCRSVKTACHACFTDADNAAGAESADTAAAKSAAVSGTADTAAGISAAAVSESAVPAECCAGLCCSAAAASVTVEFSFADYSDRDIVLPCGGGRYPAFYQARLSAASG